MKPQTLKDIESLHAYYVQETRLDIPLDQSAIRAWYDWLVWSWKNRGKRWETHDLLAVVSYVRSKYDKNYVLDMLRFRNLIRDHENFAELLSMARAAQARRKTPRQRVLEQSGRPQDDLSNMAKPASDFLKPETKDWLEKMRKAVG